MKNQDRRLFVMEGAGTSFLVYAFDDERGEAIVMCPSCGCSHVVPYQQGRVQELTLEHESDCQLLTFIEAGQEALHGK